MATATEKKRIKMRGNRRSIEDIHMGPEPDFHGEKITVERYQSVWARAANWYNYFYAPKEYQSDILKYVEEVLGHSKQEVQSLKKLADYQLNDQVKMICKLHYRGLVQPKEYKERVRVAVLEKLELAKTIAEEAQAIKKNTPPPISIQTRIKNKVYDTIYEDWDWIIDGWIEGDFKRSIDVYELFNRYQLKGQAITIFGDFVRGEYEVVSDSVNGTCDQAVEAYSHITGPNQLKMLKLMDGVFSDLERLKMSAKQTRLPRAKKIKASDKQVEKLNYLTEDIDAKLISINPVMIPTNNRLFVYNVKTKKLTMYISDAAKGFEVRGSTLYNWNEEHSKITTLRKPQDILPQIMSKTERQIDNLWDTFTTKIGVPNGRINKDCILVRVSNK
jgi:hypothetical protein